jgi:biopolymer transport protein ExbB/TolQ
LALIKFVLLAVISVVSLYFALTSIQNFMQLQREVEEAQREVEEAQREVEEAQQALKNYEQSAKQVDLARR